MHESSNKPRLTRFEDVAMVVCELRRLGITGTKLYRRITEIGPVDLDLLDAVLNDGVRA